MAKIDIFSGFLGAGKTTLIKKLLSGAYKNEKIVLIENEFGEIGIDGAFLKDAGVNITEMNSGCICCSLVGDFSKALVKVYEDFTPDRIIIEPSGVGKLSDVIKAVEDIGNEHLALNSTACVVDAKKCRVYMKNFGEFFNNQIEHAKCIFLSHTDGMSEEKLHECIHTIKEKNPHSAIISTPWDMLDNEKILAVMEGNSSLAHDIHELEEESVCPECGHHHHHHEHHEHCGCGHHHEHHHHEEHCECHHHEHEHHDDHCDCGHHHEHGHHHHHADEVFTTFGCETAKKFTADEIKVILSSLSDEEKYGTILRAKGYVATEGSDWVYFDYVPGEPDVRNGAPDVCGRICVIGSKINNSAIKELFGV